MTSEWPQILSSLVKPRDLFRGLPYEIIEYIFQQMSARDILTCATTSFQLKGVVDSSSKLGAIIDLFVEGFEIKKNWRWPTNSRAPDEASNPVGKYTKHTTVEVVSEFWKYIEKYRWLNYSSRVTIPRSTSDYPKPQLIDGIWGYVTIAKTSVGLVNPHLSTTFPVIDAASRQNMTQSAGIVYGTDFSGSRYRLLSGISGFTWDLSQDLLALFPYDGDSGWNGEIRLRTLSADTPHPAARDSILKTSVYPEDVLSVKSRIIGTYIIVKYSDRLELYNWKAKKTIGIKENVGDFISLTENLILVIFVDPLSEIVSLGVVRLQDGAVLCTFTLPLSHYTQRIRFIEDSVHSSGEFTFTDIPYKYNPGADRAIVFSSFHHGVYAGTKEV